MSEMNAAVMFENMCGYDPWPWQKDLLAESACGNRMIRVPTGFGKTLGVLGAWIWHRMECRNESWPRRLVWCLPMRVLAEQTAAEAREALSRLGWLRADAT